MPETYHISQSVHISSGTEDDEDERLIFISNYLHQIKVNIYRENLIIF